RYAVICVVIVSWRSHRYAALLFLASDYISNNYFYVSERGGTLGRPAPDVLKNSRHSIPMQGMGHLLFPVSPITDSVNLDM
ncbi:MAG: hypothetical protein IIZ54_05475, partial [Selenomonadaceae bacterium]|nr:hypothetical protein [Selenomonadaceae bacterium]